MDTLAIEGVGWVTADGTGMGWPAWPPAAAPPLSGLVAPPRAAAFDAAYQRYSRLDDYSKIGVTAIALALRDAGWEAPAGRPDGATGLVAGTRAGCLRTDVAYLETATADGGALASPALFTWTLPSLFLGEAAIAFGLRGPTCGLQAFDDPWGRALADAGRRLADGDAAAMIAGWIDAAPWGGAPAGAVFFALRPGRDGRRGALAADGGNLGALLRAGAGR